VGQGWGDQQMDDAGPHGTSKASAGTTPGADATSREALTADEMQALRLRALSKGQMAPAVEEEISIALEVAHRIRIRAGNSTIDAAYERLVFIMDCLLAQDPRLTLARDERLRLQYDIYRNAGFISRQLARVSASSSSALVICALASAVVIWIAVVMVVNFLSRHEFSKLINDIFFMNDRALTVVVSGAFLGGVVSIATRLRAFSRVRDLDPLAMFLTAMFKPLVGVVLSIFILVTLAGNVVSFGFLGDFLGFANGQDPSSDYHIPLQKLYVLWMLAFLAGFSERFAWDFVDRAQGLAQAKKDDPDANGQGTSRSG
jgi:hypothetical protein